MRSSMQIKAGSQLSLYVFDRGRKIKRFRAERWGQRYGSRTERNGRNLLRPDSIWLVLLRDISLLQRFSARNLNGLALGLPWPRWPSLLQHAKHLAPKSDCKDEQTGHPIGSFVLWMICRVPASKVCRWKSKARFWIVIIHRSVFWKKTIIITCYIKWASCSLWPKMETVQLISIPLYMLVCC